MFFDPIPLEYTTTQEATTTSFEIPSASRHALSAILRQGSQEMLAAAIEAEVAQWTEAHRHLVDARGHREVVRNGYLPERERVTGLGPLKIRQPRVHDRRDSEEREVYSSKILPPYLRKTKSLEELLPWLVTNVIAGIQFIDGVNSEQAA